MDEVFRTEFVGSNSDMKLHRIMTQPTEKLILDRNKRLRNNPGSIKDLSFGRLLASIPMIMYEKALRAGFDLNNRDADIAGKEMARFLRTPEGKACMVQPEKEGRGR